MRWIVIYPVDTVIQPLNNRGQNSANLIYDLSKMKRRVKS